MGKPGRSEKNKFITQEAKFPVDLREEIRANSENYIGTEI